MCDSLTKYIPEFDEDDARFKLAGFTREQLVDMLITASKLRRILSKELEEAEHKLRRIGVIVAEPSQLAQMPGIPSAEDLRRKFEE